MFTRHLALSLVAIAACSIPSPGQAQTPRSPFGDRGQLSTENSYHPPAIFVTDIAIASISPDGLVRGTFTTLSEAESAIGDLHYRVDLLGPLPTAEAETDIVADTAPVYDRTVSAAAIVLLPNEKKSIPFEYYAPPVPGGTYRLQIMMTTARGRDMGWRDADITLPNRSSQFADVTAGSLAIPEYPNETIAPQTGPNVNPSTSLTLRGTTRGLTTTPFAATPVLRVYEFDVARDNPEIIRGTPHTLNPQQDSPFQFPVTVAQKPGIYYGLLELQNPTSGQRLSPLAEYRWVVRGPDAAVISTRLDTLSTTPRRPTLVFIDYVGAGDAETTHTGRIHIELADDAGTLSQLTVPEVALTDAIGQGEAKLPLTRPLTGTPRVTTTIYNASGDVLDAYTVTFPLTTSQLKQLRPRLAVPPLALGILLIISGIGLAVSLVWFLWRARGKQS